MLCFFIRFKKLYSREEAFIVLLLFFQKLEWYEIETSFKNIWNRIDLFYYREPVYLKVWQQTYKKTTMSYILTVRYINSRIFIMTSTERHRILSLLKWSGNSFGGIMGFLCESDTGNYEQANTAYLKCVFVLDFIGKFFCRWIQVIIL